MLAALIAVMNPSYQQTLGWAIVVIAALTLATYFWKNEAAREARQLLVSLLVLYIASYFLLIQTVFPPNSQTLFIIKLISGAVLLGFASWYTLRCFRVSVPLMPERIDWGLLLASVLSGIFLLYLVLWVANVAVPAYYPGRLTYYGPFDIGNLNFFPVLIALSLYVLAEELFFRGTVHSFLLKHGGMFAAIGGVAAVFIATHLSLGAPYAAVLLAMSLITTWLLVATRTYFYGFVVHATLDIAAVCLVTTQFREVLMGDFTFTGRMLLFGILGLGLLLILLGTPIRARFRALAKQ